MKRRQALKSIVVVSSGLVIFPACKTDPIPITDYDNLSIHSDQFDFIKHLAQAILPTDGLEVKNPEPVHEFILTMVNDCHPLEECKKYVDGLKGLEMYIKDKYKGSFSKIGVDMQLEIFNDMKEGEEIDEAQKFFFDTTHRLAIQHFTGSEYFLSQHLEWKFVPGPYEGCVSI